MDSIDRIIHRIIFSKLPRGDSRVNRNVTSSYEVTFGHSQMGKSHGTVKKRCMVLKGHETNCDEYEYESL